MLLIAMQRITSSIIRIIEKSTRNARGCSRLAETHEHGSAFSLETLAEHRFVNLRPFQLKTT
jgi:hypothetical protein